MSGRLLRTAVLILAALAVVAPAAVAAPVAGGRYVGTLQCFECGRVELFVADDRASLLPGSSVVINTQCSVRSLIVSRAPDPLALPATGEFGWREEYVGAEVTGRFDGSVAHGEVRFDCPEAAPAPFTARLVSRPLRPRRGAATRCPSPPGFLGLVINVDPLHRGVGCTTARALGAAWRRARDCRPQQVRPRSCRVDGFACAPTSLGRFSVLSSVACRRGAKRVELIVARGCTRRGEEEFTEAINVGCAAARAVRGGWVRNVACSEPTRVGARCVPRPGWRCRATLADFFPGGVIESFCRRDGTRREAVRLAWVLPP